MMFAFIREKIIHASGKYTPVTVITNFNFAKMNKFYDFLSSLVVKVVKSAGTFE